MIAVHLALIHRLLPRTPEQVQIRYLVFSIANTTWQSKCIVEQEAPGTSIAIVWKFTTTEFVTGPNFYLNENCQGEPREATYDGRYELTGISTTTADGLSVYEINQYTASESQQTDALFQTRWFHIDGNTLSIAVETSQGLIIDESTQTFYRN